MRFLPYKAFTLSLLAAALASGCASNPDEQMAAVDSKAGLDREESNWQTPFWERWRDEGEARQQVTSANSAPDTQPGTDQRLANLALIGDLTADEAELETVAVRNGFRLINQRTVNEAMAQIEDCQDTRSMACAEALAAYPGARLVVVLEDGQATVLDPSSGAEYGAAPVSDGEALIELAADRSEIGPWAMRSFTGDDQQLYLAVGEANGLQQGQTLAVHEEGRLVRSPGGQPIAWRPGEKVGEVRISELLGPSLSTLERVSGDTPSDDHVLLLQE